MSPISLTTGLIVAPFCTGRELCALIFSHKEACELFSIETVWRQILLSHFATAFNRFSAALEDPQDDSQTDTYETRQPEDVVLLLPGCALRNIYAALAGTSAKPFVLDSKSRLRLEIHEMRDWDYYQQEFIFLRQACVIARKIHARKPLHRLEWAANARGLELVALQSIINGGDAENLLQKSGLHWGPSVRQDLEELNGKRLRRRREWWLKQRDFLLQELEWD